MNASHVQARPVGLTAVSKLYSAAKALFALLGVIVVLAVAFPAPREALMQGAAAALRATEPAGAVNFTAGQIQAEASPAVQREHPIDATLPDHRAAPDQRAEEGSEREALLEAVRALSPSLGQPVMLHLEGLSYGEIGDVLGITANAAAIRLSRAREALRDTMRKEAAR